MTILDYWPIALQTFMGIWWVSTLSSRVATLEKAEATNLRLAALEKQATEHKTHGESIARFESAIEHLTKRIEELLSEVRSKPPSRR